MIHVIFPPEYGLANDLYILALPVLILQFVSLRRRDNVRYLWAIAMWGALVFPADIICAIIDGLHNRWGDVAVDLFYAAVTVFLVWYSWRNKKKRKKALDALGAKSKALREAIVKKMREVQQPAPIPVRNN